MASAHQKVLQYLKEAYASERALTRVLESQIALTPDGSLRAALIGHLDETKHHAEWIAARLTELRQLSTPRSAARIRAESVFGQVAAFTKTPVDLVRGSGGAEKVLKNTRDACASEAYEIATYAVIEKFAVAAGDHQTAKLAASIRKEEEAMLARLLAELPAVTASVLDGSYDVTRTGAGEAVSGLATKVRGAGGSAKTKASDSANSVKSTATGAANSVKSTATGAADSVESAASGAADTAKSAVQDVADTTKTAVRNAADSASAKVHDAAAAVVGDEPWSGYDELTVPAVKAALSRADPELIRTVAVYEKAHKARAGVLKATDRDLVDV